MEGNLSGKPVAGHVHSNYARLIVNDLIVGHYQKDVVAQSTICKVKVDKTVELNNTTSIFFFESEDKQIVPNFKQYYPGLLMIQKHFLVRCLDDESHYRHYTACNAMLPEVYKEYIKCLNEDSGANFNSNLLKYDDKNYQMLTIKDYGRGLSSRVHKANENTRFEIKGPIGKGLEV